MIEQKQPTQRGGIMSDILTLDEVRALCALADMKLYLSAGDRGTWLAHLVDYKTGHRSYRSAYDKDIAANAVWEAYVNNR